MIYVFEDIELDTRRRELRFSGAAVKTEPKVLTLLEYLIKNRDRVVSRDELIENIWSGRFISDSAVSSAIKTARKAIGDNGRDQHSIKTVFGTGFRFLKEVQINESGSASPHVGASAHEIENVRLTTNIRRSTGELVGREQDAARLRDLLVDSSLVSIVGPGGAGKSALAQEMGRSILTQYPGGVWFCELASADQTQVESMVLGALDGSAGAGPVNSGRIAERLGTAPTLLILDNCEHVIDVVARLADELIQMLPELSILTTSREALDIAGENVMRIGGLDFSDATSPAVMLFQQRASEVTSIPSTYETTEIIRMITQRLDGLPLAIELAVPRLISSTPAELLATLDDQLTVLASRRRRTSARHSTMDDAIAWSFNLLDHQEQHVLKVLSEFAGAFTLEAAVAVCGTQQTSDSMHRLVQQSVVVFLPSETTSRFKLLEPIRQFAERQVDEDKADEQAKRHAEWFAERVGRLANDLRGPDEIIASEALTAEWSDFGRALAWGRANRRADIAIDPLLALEIHLLWQLRIEGFGWLEAGVEACGLSEDRKPLAFLIRAMGRWSATDLEQSEALLEESVAAGGENVGTMFFRFYQAFAREQFDKVLTTAETAFEFADRNDDMAWKTKTLAFRIVARTMVNPKDPEIDVFITALDRGLKIHRWPSGNCCALIAKLTYAVINGEVAAGEAYRQQLDQASSDCNVPWFKITAAGVGARQFGDSDDVLAKAQKSLSNLKMAMTSGDVMQLPALIRIAVTELSELNELEAAAKLMGLLPSVPGLGQNASTALGYDEAVQHVRESLHTAQLEELLRSGSQLSLVEAVKVLENAVGLPVELS